MALIKKNSEVPSNALIFVAELINSTLHEVHAKTSSICKIAFFLYIMVPKIWYISLVILSLIMKLTKNGPFFIVLYELFHSKQLLKSHTSYWYPIILFTLQNPETFRRRPAELIQTPSLIPAELNSKGEKYSFRSNCLQNTL